jgi:hypothetical protein
LFTFFNGGNSCVSGVKNTYGNGECVNVAGCFDGDGGEFERREELNVLNTRGINSITSIPSNLVFTTPNSFAI